MEICTRMGIEKMLTDTAVKAAKPRDKLYRMADMHGLCLEVKPNGTKAWRYRYRIAGKENMYAIGAYPEMSLKEARDVRNSAEALVKKGIHPSQQRQLERIVRAGELNDTFEAVAREWMLENASWWSDGYADNVRRRLEADAFPLLGKLPVKDVKPAHVLDVLRKVEKRSPAQAKLLQTWIGGAFRFAVVNLRRDDDPCFPLRRAIKTATQVNHHAILKTEKQIGDFLRAIDSAVGEFSTKAAVMLAWLTVCRVNEVVGARWSEIDFEQQRWEIPGNRMKGRQDHVIPLSFAAIGVLKSMQPLSGSLEFVFPHRSDRKKSMSPEAVRDLFRRAGYEGVFTPHGIRGTFSTHSNDAGFRSDVIELCLAHQERNKIRAAYNHAQLIPERLELLTWWANMLRQWKSGGDVVLMKKA